MAAAGFSSEWSPARRALGAGCQEPAKAAKRQGWTLGAGQRAGSGRRTGEMRPYATLARTGRPGAAATRRMMAVVLSLPNRKYH